MAKVNIPAEPQPETVVYGSFKGVDFSRDPLLVDRSRSPYAVNVISDKGGQPEKRVGWGVLHTLEKPVNGLAYGYVDGKAVFIAHGGTKLYRWTTGGTEVIKSGINSARSAIFFAQHQNKSKLFILTGNEFLMYDGASVKSVEQEATVPVVLIAKKPSGGGTILQPINLLQPKRIEKFAATGTDKIFQLGANGLDAAAVAVTQVTAAGQTTMTEGVDFSIDRAAGKITFNTAPPLPPVTGEDNIFVTYAKTVAGYADRIKKCLTFAYYGLGGGNRVFLTRNPEQKARDYWCEINDPTYFPDLNYAIIGNDNTSVMGYSKIGEYLVIIKEDNQQDTTIFVRSASLVDGKAMFSVKAGVTGSGAISPYSFVNLIDEPLFLSRTGIYAITSNLITAERTLQNRSAYVDSRLTKEPGLDKAVAVEWNGYYILSVNGDCYIMDSRQRSGARDSSFVYECYFWDNVDATCFLVHDGLLYFGTPSGTVCKLKTDVESMERFSDNGQPITAVWSTNMDNDGMPHMTKTMTKKGCLVTLKPFTRSSIKLSVKTERDTIPRLIKQDGAGVFDGWEEIDFEDFTFVSNDNARTIPFKKKIKKYQSLQFFAANDKLNQGFGLFNIVKSYIPVNYVKR